MCGCDSAYEVLDDEILRRLCADEHAARRTRVLGVRRRRGDQSDLTLDVSPLGRGQIVTSERRTEVHRDKPLRVVRGVGSQVLHMCGAEPVLETVLAEGMSACEPAGEAPAVDRVRFVSPERR